MRAVLICMKGQKWGGGVKEMKGEDLKKVISLLLKGRFLAKVDHELGCDFLGRSHLWHR